MENEELPDFKGKVVSFYISNAPAWTQSGLLLESPSFQRHGNRLFVTGRTIDESVETVNSMGSPDWAADLQAGLAWDSVYYYLVFDSADDWKAHVATYKPPAQNRFLSLFFTGIAVAVSVVILIGLIIWVIKML